jgi:hypothetical protein
VIAYKFLDEGAVAPFTRIRWTPGVWMETVESREGFGIHACRAPDLAWWIGAELWRVELSDPVRERYTQVEASRGKLIDRVAGWSASTRREFGVHCVMRTRDLAAEALHRLGLADLAKRLEGAATLELLREATAVPLPAGFAGEMMGYAQNACLAFIHTGNSAESSFIASIAAAAARGDASAFAEERSRQSRWLAELLELG